MSEAEVIKLGDAFNALGFKPKFDSPGELKQWLADVAKSGILGDEKPDVSSVPVHTVMHTPLRISTFSGDPTSKDTDYDVWKYEVECLIADKIHSEEQILPAVRKSLKGNAARVLMHLGQKVTLHDILVKFDAVFGSVDISQSLLSSFYSAKQGERESVSTFANRLEDLLSKAIDTGTVKMSDKNDMLCSALYSGLNSYLKSISVYIIKGII